MPTQNLQAEETLRVYEMIWECLPLTHRKRLSYCLENFTLDDNKDSILGSRSNIGCLDNVIFSPGAIKKVISKLKINSAAGPDYIPPVFLKKCSDFLVHPLSYLFYECFEHSFLPRAWLSAFITPILKKGDPASPSNYRPISLTCVLCKVM